MPLAHLTGTLRIGPLSVLIRPVHHGPLVVARPVLLRLGRVHDPDRDVAAVAPLSVGLSFRLVRALSEVVDHLERDLGVRVVVEDQLHGLGHVHRIC